MIKEMKCPSCGANLKVEDKREIWFCQYCGTKVHLTNENEHIFRRIDEAKIAHAEAEIAQAEAEREVQLERLKLERMRMEHEFAADTRKSASRNVLVKVWIGLLIFIILLVIILGFSGEYGSLWAFVFFIWIGAPALGALGVYVFKTLPKKDEEQRLRKMGGILLKNPYDLIDKNVFEVQRILKVYGFTNVTYEKERLTAEERASETVRKYWGCATDIRVDGEPVRNTCVVLPSSFITVRYYG